MEENPEQIASFRCLLEEFSSDVVSTFDQRDWNRLFTSDQYANCFIRWRKGDLEAATQLATETLQWRKEKQVYDLKSDDFELSFLKRGIIYVHGHAKDDTISVYFISRQQTKDMKPQVQRLLTFWLERVQQAYPGKHMTFVLDVSKASLSNVDVTGIRFMLDCFTTYFPGMLERIVIVEMPWIMNAIWKIVKQWMTEEQRRRTCFASFKELKQYFHNDQLLKYMGGTDQWEYSYPPFPDNIPDMKQQDCISIIEDPEPDESQEEEEFVVNDLEITSTSVGSPKDSSSLILESAAGILNDVDEVAPPPQEKSPLLVEGFSTEEASFVNGQTSPFLDSMRDPPSSSAEVTPMKEEPEKSKGDHLDKRAVFSGEEKTQAIPNKAGRVEEIKLNDLLYLSPVTEIVFSTRQKTSSSRFVSGMTLRSADAAESRLPVAFKMKTTSPQHYHVKPSTGKLEAGESVDIRITLLEGAEDTVEKDRFLVLYQQMEQPDENISKFWANHSAKESRFEYRVRVRFEGKTPPPTVVTPVCALTPPSAETSPLSSKGSDGDLDKLTKEIGRLRNKISQSEASNEWLRSKLRLSLILQALLLFLLLVTLYRVSSLAAALDGVWSIWLMFVRLLGGSESERLAGLPTNRPLIIAHRGSSGMLPEHTVAAYKLAVQQGADIIECDLAVTKDYRLICSHDAYLSATTDVTSHPEFADRRRRYVIAGESRTDFFTVDFTLAELKTLRTVQRFDFRDHSRDGEFPIASFDEYVAVARAGPRLVGIYPETKNPDFFNAVMQQRGRNLTVEDMLLHSLRHHGYVGASDPCLIQSFSFESLSYMHRKTKLPLVLLSKTYMPDLNMTRFAAIGFAIGVKKELVVEVDKRNRISNRTDFVRRAHARGLRVHSWVSRNEYMYLPFDYGQDPYQEYKDLIAMGVDGLFTDFAWSLHNYMTNFGDL